MMQRAATFAALTFALVGVTGAATPGLAQTGSYRLSPAVLVQAQIESGQTSSPASDAAQPAAAVLADPLPVPPSPVADSERFETLAAAVAAQGGIDADEATRCLAGAIYFEAKGEPIDGQLAVAEVVINRAKSGRFPSDICGVIKQPGQFSFVHGGVIPDIGSDRTQFRTALGVAKVAMIKAWASGAPNALFFHARSVPGSSRWVKVAAIGNHVFYR